MKNKALAYNKKYRLMAKGDRVVVGVSGGKDSVCLLHVLNELKEVLELKLIVVHINHLIRGEEAKKDAEFVKNMAEELGIPCYVEEIDVRELAKMKRMSEEEAGREARYQTMEMIRVENGFNKVAVAHHMEDAAETVIFNLARGTGAKGLSGIAPRRDELIRPILFADSREIKNYLKENNIPYREDATNAQLQYTRNKIRLRVFPYLEEEINARSVQHIAEAATRIATQYQYIEKVAKKEYVKLVRLEDEKYFYDTKEFSALEPVIQAEVIRLILKNIIANAKDIDGTHYQMIMDLSRKEVGKRIDLPNAVVVEKTYENIVFRQMSDKEKKYTEVDKFSVDCEPPCVKLATLGGECYRIRFEVKERTTELGEIPQKDYTKWFDYDKINEDIKLRNPMEGDYLTIDVEGKRKKLSRYFIDAKVPALERPEQLVLADGSHVILVLFGRVSEGYKVSDKTKKVLIVEIEKI